MKCVIPLSSTLYILHCNITHRFIRWPENVSLRCIWSDVTVFLVVNKQIFENSMKERSEGCCVDAVRDALAIGKNLFSNKSQKSPTIHIVIVYFMVFWSSGYVWFVHVKNIDTKMMSCYNS